MRTAVIIVILTVAIQGCLNSDAGNQTETNQLVFIPETVARLAKVSGLASENNKADEIILNGNATTIAENGDTVKETRVRFSDFEIVFHDFKGYDAAAYAEPENYGIDTAKVILNDDEKYTADGDNPGYRETLIVKSDTVFLFEDLDERINNTLIQIMPGNKSDKFKMSFCYLSTLYEIFDYRKYTHKELGKLEKNSIRISERTKNYTLKDSANLFFRALPHTPDMERVTVVDGEVVPVKARNTNEQLTLEQKQHDAEWNRIKKTYHLRDTLVVIPREYTVTATLTKEHKLFGYMYDSLLFRIDRYRNNKLQETKYIVIGIMYGC